MREKRNSNSLMLFLTVAGLIVAIGAAVTAVALPETRCLLHLDKCTPPPVTPDFEKFILGQWSAKKSFIQTHYAFDSTMTFLKNHTYVEEDFGSDKAPHLKYSGTWTVTALVPDNKFILKIVLPPPPPGAPPMVNTWTYTMRRIDEDSFTSEDEDYIAHRIRFDAPQTN